MKTEQAPAPLVSDEDFASVTRKVKCEICDDGKFMGDTCAVCEGLGKRDPDMYEVRDRLRPIFMSVRSELTKMRAERDELVGVMNSISITAIHSNTSGQYEVDERLIGKMNTLLSKYKTE